MNINPTSPKSPNQKPLNTRQKRFVELHILKGLSIAESYRRAGYVVGSGRVEDQGSRGCRLLKQERVKDYVRKLKERAFQADVLSFSEKRAFLARAVRADAASPDPDLVQELREEVDAEGNVKRVRKMVSKLEALNIDNKMAGDEYKDREVNITNPFLFLINLSKPNATLVQGNSPSIIDAEIVGLPAST